MRIQAKLRKSLVKANNMVSNSNSSDSTTQNRSSGIQTAILDKSAAPTSYYDSLTANTTPPSLTSKLNNDRTKTAGIFASISGDPTFTDSGVAKVGMQERQQSIKNTFYADRLTQQIKKQKAENDALRNRQSQNFTASRRRNKTGLSLLTSMDNIL